MGGARFCLVGKKVFVEFDTKGVIDDVGGDHESGEGGELKDLIVVEDCLEPSEDLVVDAPRITGDFPTELNDKLLFFIELEVVGVFAGVDEDSPEERAAYEAIGLGGDRVGKEVGESFAEKWGDLLAKRVPLHVGG
jgi:hypothetical protein